MSNFQDIYQSLAKNINKSKRVKRLIYRSTPRELVSSFCILSEDQQKEILSIVEEIPNRTHKKTNKFFSKEVFLKELQLPVIPQSQLSIEIREIIDRLLPPQEKRQETLSDLDRKSLKEITDKIHRDFDFKIPSMHTQMDYAKMVDDQWRAFYEHKPRLRQHWIDRVYNMSTVKEEKKEMVRAEKEKRTEFWMNEVKTIHWLGLLEKRDPFKILRDMLESNHELSADLSTIGYLERKRQWFGASFPIGIQVIGRPVFATKGDGYTEMLQTLDVAATNYFRERGSNIMKTPNTITNEEHVLFCEEDVKLAMINEVIVENPSFGLVVIDENYVTKEKLKQISTYLQQNGHDYLVHGGRIPFGDLF